MTVEGADRQNDGGAGYRPAQGGGGGGNAAAPGQVFQVAHIATQYVPSIEDACREFDLGTPIWLEKNIKDFKRSGRVRFTGDSFIEGIEFDYMEMSVLEEDMIF